MQYLAVSALSHDGLMREHNEDSLVVGPWTTCASTTLTPQTMAFPVENPLVVAVADGLGGHPGGEVASTLVVQELSRLAGVLGDERSVDAALRSANTAVYDAASRYHGLVGMGTTVAGVVVAAGSVVVFNVGDSRVYRVDGEGLVRLSVDDSPPLPAGETTTSIVTQTMGGSVIHSEIEPHISTVPLDPAARYLVCSDGLTDPVSEEAFGSILGRSRGLEAAVELWRAAMQAGGPDNITVAVVEVVDTATGS